MAALSEQDHILNVNALARRSVSDDRRAARSQAVRNQAIRDALRDGVSDRALSIASGLNRTMIHLIGSRGDDHTAAGRQEPRVEADVHAVGATYPCCGRRARFSVTDEQVAELLRGCHACKVGWVVTRSTLVETNRGRVDKLTWTAALEQAA